MTAHRQLATLATHLPATLLIPEAKGEARISPRYSLHELLISLPR